MSFRELKVTVNPDGTKMVDFWPGMYVKPAYQQEPTKNDPNIKADLGRVGGKLSPLKVYYPEYVDTSEIVKPALFEKVDHCPMCERKKREIIQRLRSAMLSGGNRSEAVQNMVKESERIKSELKEEGYALANSQGSVDEYPIPPPPPLPTDHIDAMIEREVASRPDEIDKSEREYKSTVDSVNKAVQSIQDTLLKILKGPSEIRLPG